MIKKLLAILMCGLLIASCSRKSEGAETTAETDTGRKTAETAPAGKKGTDVRTDGETGTGSKTPYDVTVTEEDGLVITEYAAGGEGYDSGFEASADYTAAEMPEPAYYDDGYPAPVESFDPEAQAGTLTAGVIDDRADTENYREYISSNADNYWILDLDSANPLYTERSLDLMLYFDTTGSMGDELKYIQAEATDIINRIKRDNDNIPVRISVNFYRDTGDEYVVLSTDFTSDIDTAIDFLNKQRANGGGDTPEAVHTALQDAADHSWDSANSVKLCFWFYDAPPHEGNVGNVDVKQSIIESAEKLIAKNVKFFPVASSGADLDVEVLSRQLAFITGGKYLFLTDSSGISVGAHLEPTDDTQYEEKPLNDLIVELIGSELAVVGQTYADTPLETPSPDTEIPAEQQ